MRLCKPKGAMDLVLEDKLRIGLITIHRRTEPATGPWLPSIAELELAETSAGLRPTAPDNRPVVGPGALEGLVWATGHWRNGVLLAPVTADAVAGLLCGGSLPPSLEGFSPARFARVGTERVRA